MAGDPTIRNLTVARAAPKLACRYHPSEPPAGRSKGRRGPHASAQPPQRRRHTT